MFPLIIKLRRMCIGARARYFKKLLVNEDLIEPIGAILPAKSSPCHLCCLERPVSTCVIITDRVAQMVRIRSWAHSFHRRRAEPILSFLKRVSEVIADRAPK